MTVDISANVPYLCVRTYPGCSTKIQQDFALLQETVFLVQLDQFEGSSGSVSLFFGQFVPLIQTTLAMLLLDTHDGGSGRCCCSKGKVWCCRFCWLQPALKIPKFRDNEKPLRLSRLGRTFPATWTTATIAMQRVVLALSAGQKRDGPSKSSKFNFCTQRDPT
jgi:hypothetical protein